MSDLRDKLHSHLAGETHDPATGEIIEPGADGIGRPEDSGMRVTPAKLGLTPQYLAGLIGTLQPPYDRIEVLMIWGIITNLRPVRDIEGKVWKALGGQFEGMNLITGQTLAGSTCFLPGDYHRDAVKVTTDEGMFLLGSNLENEEFDPSVFPELERSLTAAERDRKRWEPKGIEFKERYSITRNTSKSAPLGYSWMRSVRADQGDNPIRKADPLRALRAEAMSYRPSPKAMPVARPAPIIEHQPRESKFGPKGEAK